MEWFDIIVTAFLVVNTILTEVVRRRTGNHLADIEEIVEAVIRRQDDRIEKRVQRQPRDILATVGDTSPEVDTDKPRPGKPYRRE